MSIRLNDIPLHVDIISTEWYYYTGIANTTRVVPLIVRDPIRLQIGALRKLNRVASTRSVCQEPIPAIQYTCIHKHVGPPHTYPQH